MSKSVLAVFAAIPPSPFISCVRHRRSCRGHDLGLDSSGRCVDNPGVNELLFIVEDDPSLREVIRLGLEGDGFRVVTAVDGPSALFTFAAQEPDLVLLDVMLPGLDGIAVCRELRRVSLVPIVMLTARASTSDVVAGLEAGADDYVTKPFEFPELVARVRSALRRASAGQSGPENGAVATGPSVASPVGGTLLSLGALTIDPAGYSVYRQSVEIPLTVTEFRLLYELARHPGQVLTRDQLLESVWGYTYLGDSRLVDVHIQRLRAKVEEDPARPALVQTVRGVGYRAARDTP
jgi:two-component system response regulator MtrA